MEYEIKKNNKKRNIIVFSILAVLLITLGVSYAMYNKSILGTKDTKVIAGDIYMRYINGETKAITMIPSDTYNEGDYYEFTIEGKNNSSKDIIYDIKLNHGENYNSPYIRLDDKFLRFRLVTVENNVETVVDTANSYSDITNKILYVGTIPNTNNYNVTYRLYVWVNGVKVGNVNQDYTLEQWPNVYTNIKVDVTGDFVEKEADLSASKKVLKAAQLKGTTTGCTSAPLTWKDPEDNITYISGSATCIDFNYVWYSGKMWRIVAIYPDGAMKLVTDNNITSIAFGETSTGGVNFYTDENTKSYMYQWLNEDFYDTLYNASSFIDTTKQWNATQPANTTISTKPESTNLVTASVGLLNSYEYYNSYRCNGSSACTGSSYSTGYLNIGYYWWLLNPYSSSNVWGVGSSGGGSDGPTNAYGGRPSIIIKSEVSLTGEGTSNSPYKIVGDKSVGVQNEKINNRLSGEYVKLSNGTNEQVFRIVEIDGIGDSAKTKIVAMDYADNDATRQFATSTGSANTLWGSGTTTGADTWYTYLNSTYFPTLVSTYDSTHAPFISGTYTGLFANGTYYFGKSGYNYKLSICANTTSGNTKVCAKTTQVLPNSTNTNPVYIGLLRYGEMFATQQSWGSQTKKDMWLINRYSTSYVWGVYDNGNGSLNGPTIAGVGRPSIHLSSSVKIVACDTELCDGTPNHPYVVGL